MCWTHFHKIKLPIVLGDPRLGIIIFRPFILQDKSITLLTTASVLLPSTRMVCGFRARSDACGLDLFSIVICICCCLLLLLLHIYLPYRGATRAMTTDDLALGLLHY